jgi:alcohol dehydrogenase, propanol-preferring
MKAWHVVKTGSPVELADIPDPVGLAPVTHSGPGVGRDGGYAEKTLSTVEELVLVPVHVSFAQAVSATDAGATAYHAMRAVGGVGKGNRVGIIGLGGLGQIGARIGVLLGAEVRVSDIRPELAEVAGQIGAAGFRADPGEFTASGLDVVIDFAGMNTTRTAIAALRPGGRAVQVGAGKPEARRRPADGGRFSSGRLTGLKSVYYP